MDLAWLAEAGPEDDDEKKANSSPFCHPGILPLRPPARVSASIMKKRTRESKVNDNATTTIRTTTTEEHHSNDSFSTKKLKTESIEDELVTDIEDIGSSDNIRRSKIRLLSYDCKETLKEWRFQHQEVERIRTALLLWYDRVRRRLPWRGDEPPYGDREEEGKESKKKKIQRTNEVSKETIERVLMETQKRRIDPYATWVSEIMLQQTRVDTVIDYFNRWMERFPTVESLAKATDEEVNKAWVGLGYYRRARFLRNGAKYVVESRQGIVPDTVEELKQIPGIGDYTSGAIASISFAKRRPLVDGNVIRVLSRLRALAGNPKSNALKTTCWTLANELVVQGRLGRPGDFNQALMELGATTCTPRAPACERCPLSDVCRAKAEVDGTRPLVVDCTVTPEEKKLAKVPALDVTKYPLPAIKAKPKPQQRAVAVVIRSNEQNENEEVLLIRRPKTGLLAGQWEFPSVTVADGEMTPEESKRKRMIDELLGDSQQLGGLKRIVERENIGRVTHTFSHLKHFMHVERIRWRSSPKNDDETDERRRWVSFGGIQTQTRKSKDFVPLTKGMQKVLKAVVAYASKGKKRTKAMGFWTSWSKSATTTTTTTAGDDKGPRSSPSE